jgi:hypothetical protein
MSQNKKPVIRSLRCDEIDVVSGGVAGLLPPAQVTPGGDYPWCGTRPHPGTPTPGTKVS